jgi:hypothetical protein
MRTIAGRSGWSWLRATACLLALLLLGETRDMRGAGREVSAAHTTELLALDRAHAELSALMDGTADAPAMRQGVHSLRRALQPALGMLRENARGPTVELEQRIASALAQLDDDGAALAADRSEWVLSALVPIANALEETRAALREEAP